MDESLIHHASQEAGGRPYPTKLERAGLHAQKSKCQFMKSSLTFFGHRVDWTTQNGLDYTHFQRSGDSCEGSHISKSKVVLGTPKGCLLEVVSSGEKAFWCSSPLLVHFDPTLPLILVCDL